MMMRDSGLLCLGHPVFYIVINNKQGEKSSLATAGISPTRPTSGCFSIVWAFYGSTCICCQAIKINT